MRQLETQLRDMAYGTVTYQLDTGKFEVHCIPACVGDASTASMFVLPYCAGEVHACSVGGVFSKPDSRMPRVSLFLVTYTLSCFHCLSTQQ